MNITQKLAIAALTTTLLTTTAQLVHAETILGDPQPLGEGTARCFITLNEHGYPTEIGVVLSADALSNLPTEMTEVNLSLPPQGYLTAFTHVGLDWNPHGHDPNPIYGSPHFDFHFYTISRERSQQITVQGADVARTYAAPAPELIPAGYVMAPDSGVPNQGVHWINPGATEFQGQPHGFDYTFIYGFYNGEMTFLEPMISQGMLESQQSFSQPIALPAQYAQGRFYPTTYSLTYDAASQEYRVSLGDLTLRSARPAAEVADGQP